MSCIKCDKKLKDFNKDRCNLCQFLCIFDGCKKKIFFNNYCSLHVSLGRKKNPIYVKRELTEEEKNIKETKFEKHNKYLDQIEIMRENIEAFKINIPYDHLDPSSLYHDKLNNMIEEYNKTIELNNVELDIEIEEFLNFHRRMHRESHKYKHEKHEKFDKHIPEESKIDENITLNKQINDAFVILEMEKTNDKYLIKRGYYKIALKYHPDLNHSEDATEKFQEISNAYEFIIENILF